MFEIKEPFFVWKKLRRRVNCLVNRMRKGSIRSNILILFNAKNISQLMIEKVPMEMRQFNMHMKIVTAKMKSSTPFVIDFNLTNITSVPVRQEFREKIGMIPKSCFNSR